MCALVYNFNFIHQASIIKRPSKTSKTPYVADIILNNDETNTETMGHCPALGCCGHADAGCNVLVSTLDGDKKVCSHRVELAIFTETKHDKDYSVIIGINPKLAENIAESCLKANLVKNLINIKSYKREVKFKNSRFDFAGIDSDGVPFIMEIKNVPLADYVDVSKKDRKNYTELINNADFNDKIAYFPDGYRKNKGAVVSPRALKHIQELQELVEPGKQRAILCFVIQRDDASSFQTSNLDSTYKAAVKEAYENGFEINVLQLKWTMNGECYFIRNDLPINL